MQFHRSRSASGTYLLAVAHRSAWVSATPIASASVAAVASTWCTLSAWLVCNTKATRQRPSGRRATWNVVPPKRSTRCARRSSPLWRPRGRSRSSCRYHTQLLRGRQAKRSRSDIAGSRLRCRRSIVVGLAACQDRLRCLLRHHRPRLGLIGLDRLLRQAGGGLGGAVRQRRPGLRRLRRLHVHRRPGLRHLVLGVLRAGIRLHRRRSILLRKHHRRTADHGRRTASDASVRLAAQTQHSQTDSRAENGTHTEERFLAHDGMSPDRRRVWMGCDPAADRFESSRATGGLCRRDRCLFSSLFGERAGGTIANGSAIKKGTFRLSGEMHKLQSQVQTGCQFYKLVDLENSL